MLPSHSICSVVGVPCLCLLHAGGPYTASLSSPKPSKPALAPTLAVAGFNHPQLLRYAASPDPARQRYLTDLLDRAEELGLRVLRTWAHFEGRYGWQDGKQLQVQTRSSCAPLPSRCACMRLAWDACSAAAPGCPAMCLPACWPDTLLLLLNCCQATMCDSRVAAASLAGSACRRSRELITKQHSLVIRQPGLVVFLEGQGWKDTHTVAVLPARAAVDKVCTKEPKPCCLPSPAAAGSRAVRGGAAGPASHPVPERLLGRVWSRAGRLRAIPAGTCGCGCLLLRLRCVCVCAGQRRSGATCQPPWPNRYRTAAAAGRPGRLSADTAWACTGDRASVRATPYQLLEHFPSIRECSGSRAP